MTKKKELDYNKVIEFCNYPSLFKFKTQAISHKFIDGSCMGYFWKHYKIKIKELNDDISIEIYKQYDEFLKLMKEATERRYIEKLIEFAENKSFSKFFSSDEKFKSSESTLKSFWYTNKNKILTGEDEVSKRVVRQYSLALKKQELMILKTIKINKEYEPIDLENFLDRLYDFIEAPKEKYSSTSGLTFYDGADMHGWFIRSKDRIKKYKPQVYEILIKEYNIYMQTRYLDKEKEIGDINERKSK